VPLERLKCSLVKNLRDKSHVFKDEDLVSVCSCDSSRFLAPVLEGIEPEVGEFGYLFTLGPNAKDPAFILRAFFARQYVVI
jgi:hypothetical protein